ncbi:hypothetical protein SCHPADRAFT_13845 [Schizopora paradoxa]|uniref:Uncharacterized protein n=1 Tax=Schizopora paradoxa TaxID=27342 RepID=A0A0H2SU10_9AGAM|nr:hypothetical protein SCHPADRAFT_13845 [Schizopora paradoxa]
MINPFSTSTSRKDSGLQTMKRRLCGRLSGARTKPSDEIDNKTLCSFTDSDCSTLVDFDLDDVVEDVETDDVEEDSLPFEEQSWTRRAASHQPRIPRSAATFYNRGYSELNESLLDEEECSWVMPRSTTTSASKSRFALFARQPKQISVRVGLEPQLLEPEERSWM